MIPTLGARELLDKLLHSWAGFERHGYRRPPRTPPDLYYRFLQAEVLARVLELGTVGDVVSGAFIARSKPDVYRHLYEQLRAASRLPEPILARLSHWGDRSLDRAYVSLLTFRRRARDLLHYNEGWIECSDPVMLGMIRMTDEAAAPLRAALEPIDAILLEFLDPEQRRFSERELIERCGYPDVDIHELELEWK